MKPIETITVRRVKYVVERVRRSESDLFPIRFMLHRPGGRPYWVVPSRERPDRLVAICSITSFGPYRHPPFPGTWFAEGDDGELVIAPADA